MTIEKFAQIRQTILDELMVELPTELCSKAFIWLLNHCKCYCFACPTGEGMSTVFLDMQRYMDAGTCDPRDF